MGRAGRAARRGSAGGDSGGGSGEGADVSATMANESETRRRLADIRAAVEAHGEENYLIWSHRAVRLLLSVVDRLTAERDEAISNREGIGDTEIRRLIRERDEYRNQVRELRK